MAFPDGWKYRLAITIDKDDIDGDLSDWTMVFYQTFNSVLTQVDGPLDADGSAASLNGGGDIRFSSDEDGLTRLACDIRDWSTNNTPASATCEVAVKISSVSSSTDTTIYMWWGKSGEVQPAVGDTYGRYNAYDSNYKAVWSLNEDPSGTAPQMVDRTSGGNHATTLGSMSSGQSVAAKVSNGLNFISGDSLSIPGNLSATDITIETILNPSNTAGINSLIRDSDIYIGLYIHDGKVQLYWSNWRSLSYSISTSSWSHCGYKKSGSDHYLLKNGAQVSSMESLSGTFTLSGFEIAGDGYGQRYEGILDEFRISNVARSNAWIKANYENQFNTAGFLTWGSIDNGANGYSFGYVLH